MELTFQEDNFIVKTLSTHEEFEQAMRLRHDVFAEELKWVPASPDRMERDLYDDFSQYIGIFDLDEKLVGHARLIIAPDPFMLDDEFACLVPDNSKIKKSHDASEITRLCVKKEERAGRNFAKISQLIYKGIYNWSLGENIRHMAMVVDKRYYRLLRLTGFPVKTLNAFHTMPDGVQAAAITLDWREFEDISQSKRPDFLEWISKLPDRYPSQSLSHELYLQH